MIILDLDNTIIKMNNNVLHTCFSKFPSNKKCISNGNYYTVNIFHFHGDYDIQKIFKDINRINVIWKNIKDECHIWENLNRVGYYFNTNNLENLQRNLSYYLELKDFEHNIFKQLGDFGFYYFNVVERNIIKKINHI